MSSTRVAALERLIEKRRQERQQDPTKQEAFIRRVREVREWERNGKYYYCSCTIPAPTEEWECNDCGSKIQRGIRCKRHNRVLCEDCDHDGEPR